MVLQLSTGILVNDLKVDKWLSHLAEHATLVLWVMHSSPTLGVQITLKKKRVKKNKEDLKETPERSKMESEM